MEKTAHFLGECSVDCMGRSCLHPLRVYKGRSLKHTECFQRKKKTITSGEGWDSWRHETIPGSCMRKMSIQDPTSLGHLKSQLKWPLATCLYLKKSAQNCRTIQDLQCLKLVISIFISFPYVLGTEHLVTSHFSESNFQIPLIYTGGLVQETLVCLIDFMWVTWQYKSRV